MTQNNQPTKDTYYRFIFADGEAVGKAFVLVAGDTKQGYSSSLEIIATRDSEIAHPGRANEMLREALMGKYQDLFALEAFLRKNPEIDPKSLTFRNACARAGLTPPPMFNENHGIYLRQDWYGPVAKRGDAVRDALLVANARESHHNFSADFPVIEAGKTRYFDL